MSKEESSNAEPPPLSSTPPPPPPAPLVSSPPRSSSLSSSQSPSAPPSSKVSRKPRSNTEIERAETTCGFGGWEPQWLQMFASANYFVINFSILAILQGALFTYMVGIMSTLEKRFAFETKVSGFILIADNLSQMVVSPIVGYLGSKYNRSRLIAVGELVVALSCIMSAIPYFLYGPGIHLLSSHEKGSNYTNYELCTEKEPEQCETGGHSTVMLAVVILWLSCFANGLGYTAFYTIGLPYVDDNIKKKNSAMYLSAISTLRLLGPTLGFVLSAICLKFYEDPFYDPGIQNNDPRWIGAWWLGFLILGISILIFTIPMFMFPKKFKDMKDTKDEQGIVISTLKDAKKAFKRLSKNYLLIFHMAGGVFRLIGYLGYYIIKPKYLELQYRQSASSASFFTGATSVVTMAIGTMAGGIIIRYAKPSPRYIAFFVCLVELISTLGIFTAMFLQCPTPKFNGLEMINQNSVNQSTCYASCDCTTQVHQPVCAPDGVTNYFSPCYAGCRSYESINNTSIFTDCSCIEGPINVTPSDTNMITKLTQWAQNGLCERECNMFPIYISVLAMSNTIASTARTGDTLITLRSVHPADKNFAMGVMGSIFAIFAFIPYPLIFGAIIDTTCLVWEKSCGKGGNCWLYDMDKFRVYLHTSAFAFLLVGVLCEIGTVVFAGRIKNLYDDEDENEGEEGNGETKNRLELKPVDNGNNKDNGLITTAPEPTYENIKLSSTNGDDDMNGSNGK